VTSDNPRSEDPQQILDEICRGLTADMRVFPSSTGPAPTPGHVERSGLPKRSELADGRRSEEPRVVTIVNRRDAIAKAIEIARPDDLVIVAGKGHEKYQTIGNRSLPFDDAEVARGALTKRRSNSGVR
jgi:UDP-N-acetylmuramoyl-L-alanyl-D-glutamate--2,6-diaminopimelate ligase